MRGETDTGELLELGQTLQEHAAAATRYREWTMQAAEKLPDSRFDALPHTLIHGDVQPANIIIEDSGRAVG